MENLPPPDPYESFGEAPDGVQFVAPAVIYLERAPSAETERLAVAILAARPGALVVFGSR